MVTNIAVIGAGVIATVHARVLAGLESAKVTWVADVDGDKASALAGEVGARATTDSAKAISASDVDAVVVAVPTPAHREITELAAMYGKHVFCEKPIARTMADAQAIVATCQRASVRLMVGQVVRFFPEYARAKAVLEAGTLGQIGIVRASRVGGSPAGTRPWMIDPVAGGGVVIDLMIHELDTLRWFFGDIKRVFAHGATAEMGVDYAQAVLRFEEGAVAHVEASWAHAGFRTRFEIAAEHGILAHDSDEIAPIRLDLPGQAERPAAVYRLPAADYRPYIAQLEHFITNLAGDRPFLAEGDDGVRALGASLAVLESARTGKPVQFTGGHPRLKEAAA